MALTVKEKEQIKKQGYANTGGIPRNIYWTPDGRRIEAIPSLREYNRKDENGDVIGSGTRDANLDRGWLLSSPKNPKPYCAGCDRWHDTDEEVIKCIADRQETSRKWEDYARKEKEKEVQEQSQDIEALRTDVIELKGDIYIMMEQNKKLMKLLEDKK